MITPDSTHQPIWSMIRLRFPSTARLLLVLSMLGKLSVYAQSASQIDSLLTDGLPLSTGWRWHPGDNPAWANPSFDDSRWDSIRPGRAISRLETVKNYPLGWLRHTFTITATAHPISLAATLNQAGASAIYIDGSLWQRLGQVGSTYQAQQAYTPSDQAIYMLPPLAPGRHVLAVRLSQQQPPWYSPKFLYLTLPVFRITLYEAQNLAVSQFRRLYTQSLGNYLVVGIFLMLGVIHFLYYYYRRKRVNLVFGLTMLFGALCITLVESMGSITDPSIGEWIILGQGLFMSLFMLMLLVTYYVYLLQPLSWFLLIEGVLLIIPRFIMSIFSSWQIASVLSILAITGLFADGIRVSINAIRAKHVNARFMLGSILVMLVILLVGGFMSWWLSTYFPVNNLILSAITNLLFFLTLPITFATILAREHAQTNRNLEERLIEVQQLSAEKESILTRQNETLEQQVTQRTAELTQSLTDLRETQQQLIQREKMASLGELTAGIAHEIQNPLNFVNNFAEVSEELLGELRDEQQKGADRDPTLEEELMDDLAGNLQRIRQHGNRAASIIKGMLGHARINTGQREPTDLNALCDEYLRLSYHGLRASDKQFNAHLETHFDPGLSRVSVVAQDLGRVLLNLFNNAFYAVRERASRTDSAGYQPTVVVSTQQEATGITITIQDNGTGIPDTVREKVFNPFFTTKPTGQGTGLGLSLSYDIITKGHSGQLTFDSVPDQGTSFTIWLPAKP